jgi:uncharacterized protein
MSSSRRPHLGDVAFETYRAHTGNVPPDLLIDFYASARAMLRAKLAIAHLEDEHRPDAEKWRAHYALPLHRRRSRL